MDKINRIMLGVVVLLGALIGIVWAAGAQSIYHGAGIICDTALEAKTVSDDLRSPAIEVSDETNELLNQGACFMKENLVAIILHQIREGPYPIYAVQSVHGESTGFLITDD